MFYFLEGVDLQNYANDTALYSAAAIQECAVEKLKDFSSFLTLS